MTNFKKLVARLFPCRILSSLSHRLSLEQLETRAVPATLEWDGGRGTTAAEVTAWERVDNWIVRKADPATNPADAGLTEGKRSTRAPGPSDTVQFKFAPHQPNGEEFDCNITQEDVTVANLNFIGYRRTLTTSKKLTVTNGGVLDAGATLSGAGDIVIGTGATFTWKKGAMSAPNTGAKTIVQQGATIVIDTGTGDDRFDTAILAGRTLAIDKATNAGVAAGRVTFKAGTLLFKKDPFTTAPDVPKKAEIQNWGTFSVEGTAKGFVSTPGLGLFTNYGLLSIELNQDNAEFSSEVPFGNITPDKTNPAAAGTGVSVKKGDFVLYADSASEAARWEIAAGRNVILRRKENRDPPTLGLSGKTRFIGGTLDITDGTRVVLVTTTDSVKLSHLRLEAGVGGLERIKDSTRDISVTQFTWVSGTINDVHLVLEDKGTALIYAWNANSNLRACNRT